MKILHRVMEARDHSKNGASPKGQRSRRNFRIFTIFAFVASAFVLASCDKSNNANTDGRVETLIITSPHYGDIYHCGEWVDIFVSGCL